VSALTGNDWQANGDHVGKVVATNYSAPSASDKLTAIRDTLIVFSMQLVFRTTMFLRHLNY
jgi:hypothetical protein